MAEPKSSPKGKKGKEESDGDEPIPATPKRKKKDRRDDADGDKPDPATPEADPLLSRYKWSKAVQEASGGLTERLEEARQDSDAFRRLEAVLVPAERAKDPVNARSGGSVAIGRGPRGGNEICVGDGSEQWGTRDEGRRSSAEERRC